MAYRYIDLSLFSISVFICGLQTYDPLPSIEHPPPPPKEKILSHHIRWILGIWFRYV